jgi:GTPase
VKTLTARLEKIQQQRGTGRQQRAEIPIPSLALVGYTNAGKSTLFRALTGADAYIADQLFATLDPTVRRITLPGNTPVVVADTVGFIRELPHDLVAAFKSTLTEAREATLLLHVVDVSDPRRDEHIDEVNRVLAEIGAADLPQILVFNKIDRLEAAPRIERDDNGRVSHVWLSAIRSEGLKELLEAVAERLARVARRATLRLPVSAGEIRARLYAANLVRAERIADDGSFEIDTELSEFELLKWAREPGVEVVALSESSACTVTGGYLQSSPALRSS